MMAILYQHLLSAFITCIYDSILINTGTDIYFGINSVAAFIRLTNQT